MLSCFGLILSFEMFLCFRVFGLVAVHRWISGGRIYQNFVFYGALLYFLSDCLYLIGLIIYAFSVEGNRNRSTIFDIPSFPLFLTPRLYCCFAAFFLKHNHKEANPYNNSLLQLKDRQFIDIPAGIIVLIFTAL
jgi:hypothetical protein